MNHNIKFSSQNFDLVGDIFVPIQDVEKDSAILFIQGWNTDRTKDNEYSLALSKQGYLCMTFDFAGQGDSPGDASTISRKEFLEQAATAYDVFASLDQTQDKLLNIVGSSFGGYIASMLTDIREIDNLGLRVPQNYPDLGFDKPKTELDGEQLKSWRAANHHLSETKSLTALNRFKGQVLIIESEFDEYVNIETIEDYKQAVKDDTKLTYHFMPDTNHSLKRKHEKDNYVDILLNWLKIIETSNTH